MEKKMLALKLLGDKKAQVAQIDIPAPQKGEVLIKVYASAICGSEKPDYMNPRESYTLSGHETVGVVADANGSPILNEGDKVALYALYGCGECHWCKMGDYQFCTSIQGVSNSGHAQYTVCRDTNCIKIKEGIAFDDAVLLYGDSMGVAHRAINSCGAKAGDTAYVIGAGPIGLGIIAYLKHLGLRVLVGEPSKYRRELACEKLDVDAAIDPINEDVSHFISEQTNGIGPDCVFECSGTSAGELAALSQVCCKGCVCFAGENYKGLTIIPSENIIHREVRLTGAFYYSPHDVSEIVKQYESGLDISRVVTHKFSIAQADEAFHMFMRGETGKVIIHPWD